MAPKKKNNKVPKVFEKVADEIFKPARKRFPTRHVISYGPDDIWSVDIADMNDVKQYNDGVRYMLNAVDCFTRYAWSVPMTNKNKETTLEALERMIEENNGKYPINMWCDQGTEFYNEVVEKWRLEHSINLYSVYGTHKSAVVERFNRTIKTKLYKMFYATANKEWVTRLPGLIEEYNNTIHSVIGMTPKEAHDIKSIKGIRDLFDQQQADTFRENSGPAKFKVGQFVRVSRVKDTFEKGYHQSWTNELFIVTKVIDAVPWTYHIEDIEHEKVDGSFYEDELQLSKQNKITDFIIEEVEKTEKRNGKDFSFIKWQGYPKKFNSWVATSSIKEKKE